MGEVPRRLRGIEADATTTWRFQTCDLLGPFECKAWPGQRQGQRHAVSLKTWALLLCDYSTQGARGALCEDYSAESMLQALRTLWASTGLPTHLTFDAAQNLVAARTIFGGVKEDVEWTERLTNQLTGTLGHLMEIRRPVSYASHSRGYL